jgi:phage major head subunit gpT-like protein
MANRARRRRRDRMILAGATVPFTLDAHATVQIEAAAPEAGDATAPARVRIDAYSGGVMTVSNLGPVVVDVTGIDAEGRVVLLSGHENTLTATLGSATVQVVDGQRLLATGEIARTNPIAATAIDLSRAGVPLQASIGAEPIEPPIRIRGGDTVTVNGRAITAGPGGFLLYRRTRLRHIAILPNGADARTSVSIAAAAANQEGANVDFQKWVESLGYVYADLTPEQTAVLQDVYDRIVAAENADDTAEGETAPAPVAAAAAPEMVAAYRAELAAESTRVAAIRAVCGDRHCNIAAQAITEGWDSARTTSAVQEAVRASRPRLPAIHTKESGSVNTKIIEASLCMAAGLDVEKSYNEETLDRASKFRRRGLRWHAEQIAAAKGHAIEADPGTMEWIRAAFSTSELSGVVGNVANKALQDAFAMAPSVAEQITATRSHANFQPNTVYSLALNGELQPVAKDGELKHLRMSEESRTRQVETRGAILSISRQDLINDDLNAFADNAKALGRKAVHSREKTLFAALNATANGSSFFTSARGNYFEGAATNLQSSSLATAVQMFRDQVGPDGLPVMVDPTILLVPTALEQAAKELMNSQYVVGPTSAKTPSANIWQGSFQPLVSPWLSNSTLTGASSTAWYLLGNPADLAALEIAYLNGLQTPTVEFFGMDTTPDVLGVSWRVFWDFGVALAEYRAGVKSKGAA